MTTAFDDTEFSGSNEKSLNGYGQNGYGGPSSDLPGQATRTNRAYSLPADPVVDAARSRFDEGANWQTRTVSKEGYPPAHGMKGPAPSATISGGNVRRSRVQAATGSFQR